ncbi:Hypothetical predicted protein [Scomber scombrus]|uniref:Uncharacterized protein n=1 Tax=Scomber scombrus TaxID=13677 RepID=A0AAV1PHH0_SCOSC
MVKSELVYFTLLNFGNPGEKLGFIRKSAGDSDADVTLKILHRNLKVQDEAGMKNMKSCVAITLFRGLTLHELIDKWWLYVSRKD